MYIDLLILLQIEKAPKHGYEIKKEIQKELGYMMDVNHNLLYPTLRRFTEEGVITKKKNEQEGKPNQYVYEITEAGEKKIVNLINEFTEKDAKHQIDFMIRVSLFDHISQHSRLRILNMRKIDLEGLLVDIEKRQENCANDIYRREVLQYSMSQARGELIWIDELIRKTEG
ncbi:PadR family transcriptional regulator [Paenibacillus mendelii]|uniref:PadR family transcriptional regulator n=1 Tax=Paenibacillus mendelii TaxID=206163 RepID=A0ABV6JAL8_9BACL|nr:PadR family transcriptional regulator [Paenibacillus mendelii]MCQ6563784.1 PadR family transcriptional regulator [Paenibacillus mendelii]